MTSSPESRSPVAQATPNHIAGDTAASEHVVDKSGERIKKMFGEISPRYDLMNHVLSGGVDYLWRAYTIRKVPPRNHAPILDVCCGTGDLAIAYWKKAKQQVEVFGTDFTPEMLEIARKKVGNQKAAHNSPINFIEADTQHLPFPESTFQIVSVAFGLRNVADTRAGIKEMLRVCQTGGKVVVLEFSQPTLPVFAGLYRWYFKNILPRIGQFFMKNRQDAYTYLPQSVAEFPCGKQLAEIMQECGLRNVTFTPLTLGIATLYVGEK